MGMNYYLMRKERYSEESPFPACLGCTYSGETEVRKLSNGWIWNDTYYPTLEELNESYCQKIHIGKSSSGWRFSLCVYPSENPRYKNDRFRQIYLPEPISSFEDWLRLFNDPKNYIIDECGRRVSIEDMVAKITKRAPHESLKDGWQHLNGDSTTLYRAIDGLLVHDYSKVRFWGSCYTTLMPRGYTYDLILSGNDTESGDIFS